MRDHRSRPGGISRVFHEYRFRSISAYPEPAVGLVHTPAHPEPVEGLAHHERISPDNQMALFAYQQLICPQSHPMLELTGN